MSDDIRATPMSRDWDVLVQSPTLGYGHTGVFGVFSSNAYFAMSLDIDKLSCDIRDIHRYFWKFLTWRIATSLVGIQER